MPFDPKVGDVIRFDFVWKDQQKAGAQHGVKDRPCAVVIATTPRDDGSRRLMLAPITHTPPTQGEGGVEIPSKVAQHLGLDDTRCWIKTHEVNTLTQEKGQIPVGFSPVPTGSRKGEWSHGSLPEKLGMMATSQVLEHHKCRQLKQVDRDEKPPKPVRPKPTDNRPRPVKPEPGQKQDKDRGRDR